VESEYKGTFVKTETLKQAQSKNDKDNQKKNKFMFAFLSLKAHTSFNILSIMTVQVIYY